MLKPNKVYKMDCLDFIRNMDNVSLDLGIIDGPYNMAVDEWDKFPSEIAFRLFNYNWIDALIPKLKKTGSLYIFNTPYNSAFILTHVVNGINPNSLHLKFRNWITWYKKDGMSGSTKRYNHSQETILFFTVSDDYTFNHDAIRIPYESTERMKTARTKGIIKNGKRWFPNPIGKLCPEVWEIVSERHKCKVNGKVQSLGHATPKPMEMIERIIKASSNPGDLVFDCFSGTGTTALAAKRLGRNFFCADSNEDYVKMANAKLNI